MGRVNATFLFIDWGPLPLGSLLGGLLATVFGPRAALIAAAICGVIGAVWIATSPAARLTSLADMVAADGGGPAGGPDGEERSPALDPSLLA